MSLARCVPRSREAMTPQAEAARILVVDADPALFGLLEEWLAEEGFRLVDEDPDLVVVDLPRRKHEGVNRVNELVARQPGRPLVALSSNFFAGVETNGGVARALGVKAVLAKPLTREALIGALRKLLPQIE